MLPRNHPDRISACCLIINVTEEGIVASEVMLPGEA